MVRRLSFINTFNQIQTSNLKTLRISRIDASVNALYYMRQPFTYRFITKHHRRYAWRRRKHNFEYTLYLNILSMWASEYVFMRKLIKFNYNYCITKTSLLVYNLASLRNTSSALAKNSEHVYLATLSKNIINYFLKFQYNFHTYWRQSVETSLVFSSYYQNAPTDEIFKTNLISPSYLYSTSTLYPISNTSYLNFNDSWDLLFDQIFVKYYYSIMTEIYKIHILLLLNINRVELECNN